MLSVESFGLSQYLHQIHRVGLHHAIYIRSISHYKRLIYQTPSKRELGTAFKATTTSGEEPTKDQHELADHRSLGTSLSLFTTHPSSPGSPLFHPDGSHVLQKLQYFLRAQFPLYGIREVLTPTIYKKSVWERSGHWDNYQDDMFTVTGRSAYGSKDFDKQIGEDEEYGLKPMNCPGHCLLFQSQKRSYRDLPLRFADFSPLHRNELSGSLSGLTRLRRFHQDDAHIFCRPDQVGQEVETTLEFVEMVYKLFDVGSYEFILSTRPTTQYIGSVDDWDLAEAQLKGALTRSSNSYRVNEGDGAFYGPKIDVVLTDRNGNKHQTATIQLDFQLPQRFQLEYQGPATEQKHQGLTMDSQAKTEMITPVIIHRAIFGSLERFMALLIERFQGSWPFWLSPRQLMIVTVGDDKRIDEYAAALTKELTAPDAQGKPRKLNSLTFTVGLDASKKSLSKKILDARMKRYNIICVIGERNLKTELLDLSLCNRSNTQAVWSIVEKIKPGFQGPVQEPTTNRHRNMPGFRLTKDELTVFMEKLCDSYL